MITPEQQNEPSITVIGGGSGSFTLLSELKLATPNITAVVNMSDDGGSTGRLRDELGVLPPGDVRQCLVALSNLPEARDMFDYRFDTAGPLNEHCLGNLILSALELRYGNFQKAVKLASKLLDISGQVVPITTDRHTLTMQDGAELVSGEFKIGHRPICNPGARLAHEPRARISNEAEEAIVTSNMVVIAPGNLYGSLLPALSVSGVREAFAASSAKKVLVANLVTKPGQTDGWHVVDYVREVETYCGQGSIDSALYNTRLPALELLKRYAADGEMPVGTCEKRFQAGEVKANCVGADILAGAIYQRDPADKSMSRTLIRHDAKKVVTKLLEIAAQYDDSE